jgi:hypothetical protein
MKNIIFLLLAILCAISCGQNKMEVEWYEGERDPETGIKKYTIVLKNIPKDARDWSLWFSMPWCKNFATDSLSTAQLLEVEAVSYRIVPFRNEDGTAILSPGDSVVVNFYSPVRFSFRAWDAEGFAFQNGDEEPEEVNVNYHYLPLADDTERVKAFGSKMKYIEPSLHDMIPSLKEVEYSANMSEVHIKADDLQVRHISENHPKGWYRLIIGEESYAEVTDRSGARYARTTLLKLLENSTDGTLPCMKIEDWPDLEHRGLMLDVARKFVPVWKLKEYLDLMSRYKLNRCLKNTAKMLYGDHRADAISNHTARRTFLSNIANEIYERLTEVFECTEFDVYRSENTITIEKLMDSDDGITAIELEFYDRYITIYGLYHGCGVDINDVVSIESDDVDDIYEKIEDMLCIAYGKIAENDMRGFLLQYYEE